MPTVKSALADTHDQTFLRGHNDTVMVLQLSPSVSQEHGARLAPSHHTLRRRASLPGLHWYNSRLQGKLLASGQAGKDSDVLVWDTTTNELLYRFEEHDGGESLLACLAYLQSPATHTAVSLPFQVLWTLPFQMMSDCLPALGLHQMER